MSRILLVLLLTAIAGCSGDSGFQLDQEKSFRIELGRGSGMHGLQTVRVEQDGTVTLARFKKFPDEWKKTQFPIKPIAVAEIVKAVEKTGVMKLDRRYTAEIWDGTQWVLWIKQGDKEKSIYFDNKFPDEIKSFADELDKIVDAAMPAKVEWHDAAKPDRELWDSIRR